MTTEEMQATDDGMPEPEVSRAAMLAASRPLAEGTIVRSTWRRVGAQRGQVIGFDTDMRLPLVRWFDGNVEAVEPGEYEVTR